jgi:hypothetical protein
MPNASDQTGGNGATRDRHRATAEPLLQQKIVEARVAVVAWRVPFPQTAQPVGDLTAGHDACLLAEGFSSSIDWL